ncbi:MAG: lipid A deacylase LpxR family protein [Bacteroidia bacterium]
MKYFFSILISTYSLHLYGQQADTTLEIPEHGYFSYRYENDVFTSTDYYYTQGVKATLVLPVLKQSPLHILLASLPRSTNESNGVFLQQDCYTPTNLAADSLLNHDRPYAGAIFAGEFRVSNDKLRYRRITSGIDLGMLGRCAMCEEEQKAIHRALVDQQPLGWGFQIRPDVLFNYSLGFDQGIWVSHVVEFILQGKMEAGTYKDNLSGGGLFRVGLMKAYFNPLGLSRGRNEREFYAFLQGSASFVAYNALLQGGLIDRDNPYVIQASGVMRMVYKFSAGYTISIKKFSFTYSQTYLSPEFEGGLNHAWGSITLQYRF